MIIGNSASNYKQMPINQKFTFTQLNIINSTIQHQTFFRSDNNWFTSTNLVLRALTLTVSKR